MEKCLAVLCLPSPAPLKASDDHNSGEKGVSRLSKYEMIVFNEEQGPFLPT